MEKTIKEIFKTYGYDLKQNQIDLFLKYYNFLIEENRKYNLTAITEPMEVMVKHFIDSIIAEKFIKKNSKVIDIGSGAGFPGVPLKILRPDLKITLLDSLNKRINFLNQLIDILKLKDIEAVHARAEDFVKCCREKYDVALSRAVAQVPTLAEYLIPYVKINGTIIMYKGINVKEEIEKGKKAIEILGAKIEAEETFYLKEVESLRSIIILKKIKATPKQYPRDKNKAKTSPIS